MKLQKTILIAFLLLQGVVPVWALVMPSHQTRTDFTWDMFAVRRDCAPCQLWYTIGEGEPERISWGLRAPPLVLDSTPGFFDALTMTRMERGENEPRGFWDTVWNARELQPGSVEARDGFDDLGMGTLLFYPSSRSSPGRFALNVRSAPQVARLKSARRLTRVGEQACTELEASLLAVLTSENPDPWLAQQAERWESSGRRLVVHGVCECSYNNSDAIPVIEEGANLCGARP